MAFYLKVLGSRIGGVLYSPVKTWKSIRKEPGYTIESLVFLFFCCLLIGLLSLTKGKTSWLSEIFIPFLTVFISSVFIRFFKEIKKVNWECSFNLIVFPYYPLLLCYAFSFLNYRQYILPAGLILSTILLFTAIKSSLDISIAKSLSLTLKITLTVFFCFFTLMVLLSA